MGRSRLVEVDPLRRAVVWEYVADPPESFFSTVAGGCERLPNGNVLVTEAQRGRVLPDHARLSGHLVLADAGSTAGGEEEQGVAVPDVSGARRRRGEDPTELRPGAGALPVPPASSQVPWIAGQTRGHVTGVVMADEVPKLLCTRGLGRQRPEGRHCGVVEAEPEAPEFLHSEQQHEGGHQGLRMADHQDSTRRAGIGVS